MFLGPVPDGAAGTGPSSLARFHEGYKPLKSLRLYMATDIIKKTYIKKQSCVT
jgi:hypothetical protein